MDYNILVNVKIKSAIQTNYEFKQQDYGQKLIVMAEDYDINGTTARLFINKNDGTVNERIMTKENNNYTYTLDAEDTSCAGKTVFDVKYYKQGVRDSSASFIFNIIPDRFGNLIESKTMSDSLQSALDRVDKTKEIVDEYDEKIEQINKASERAENSATNSVIAVANCEQATNKANVATDRANTAAATAEGIAENKTGINDNAVGASTTWSSSKINTSLANQISTVQGSNINIQNTFNGGLLLKELQGKSVQNGTPSPTNKVDIVSVGDSGSVVAKVCGKNLLNIRVSNGSYNGITWINNNDGSITLNGTATGNLSLRLTTSTISASDNPFYLNGTYTFSTNNTSNIKTVIMKYKTWDPVMTSSSMVKTQSINESDLFLFIEIATGATFNNQVYKPQLELGTTSTAYEPYKEQLVTIPLTQPLRSVGSVYDRGCVKSNGLWGNERKFATKIFDGSSDENWEYNGGDAAISVDYAYYYIGLTRNGAQISAMSNIFPVRNLTLWGANEEGLVLNSALNQITLKIKKSHLVGWGESLTSPQKASLFKTWLTSNPLIVQYQLATPVFEEYNQALQDQLNKLQSNQGTTNVFTTDPQQPVIVVSYGKTDSSALALYAENVSDNKLDKSKSVNNLITTVEGTVLDGRQGKALSDKIGNLSDLKTVSKTDLVGSVNEVKASVDVVNNNLQLLSGGTSSVPNTITTPLKSIMTTGVYGYTASDSSAITDLPTSKVFVDGGVVIVSRYDNYITYKIVSTNYNVSECKIANGFMYIGTNTIVWA